MQRGWIARILVAIFVAVCLVSCGKKNTKSVAETAGRAPLIASVGAPVTLAEAEEFGRRLETAIADGELATAKDLLRLKNILESSISDLGLSAAQLKTIVAGGEEGANLTNELIAIVQGGGSFRFLRAREKSNRVHAVLRLETPDFSINYQEIALVRYPDKRVAAADIYTAASGEYLSQTFRRSLVAFLAERKQNFFQKLMGAEQLYTKNIDKLKIITEAAQTGKGNAEALAAYRSLPIELQKEKQFLVLATQCAMSSSEEEYLELLTRFKKYYPDDPATSLMLIDYHFLRKEYDKSLDAVEKLDQFVGGDPHLLILSAGILISAERLDDARSRLLRYLEIGEPNHRCVDLLAQVAARQGKFADTVGHLKRLVEEFGAEIDFEPLLSEEYGKFGGSKQFDEFKKWYAQKRDS